MPRVIQALKRTPATFEERSDGTRAPVPRVFVVLQCGHRFTLEPAPDPMPLALDCPECGKKASEH